MKPLILLCFLHSAEPSYENKSAYARNGIPPFNGTWININVFKTSRHFTTSWARLIQT